MQKYFFTTMLALFPWLAVAASPPLAVQLDAQNIGQLQPGGPDAIAGLGDWVLSNGTLCAAISDIEHETGFNPWGGALIDVHHCGADDDQWPFQHALPNLDKDKPLQPVLITSSAQAGVAAVVVTARGYGLQLRSQYQVDQSRPRRLLIEHQLRRLEDGEPVTMFGLLMLHPHMSLTPFSHSTIEPEYSRGFSYASLDRQDSMSMLAGMLPADIHVFVGSPQLSQISYGVQLQKAVLIDRDGESRDLPRFALTDPSYTFQGVLSRPPWLGGAGKLGLLEFAQSRLMDIKVGETLAIEQSIFLGDRADVASASDLIYRGPIVSGKVESADSMVHIRDESGVLLTSVRPRENGEFRARLPLDSREISIAVNTPWGAAQAPGISLEENGGEVTMPPAPQPSFVKLPLSSPMRLIFRGLGDTPDPDFNDNFLGFSIDGEVVKEVQSANYVSLAGAAGDPSAVALPPGEYRVLATRGMAFSVTEAQITLAQGETVTLNIAPPVRELATAGWLAADLHVHSAASFDSYMPVAARLRGFVAQGSDVLVATEHNAIVNYQDTARKLGLDGRLAIVSGTELTGMARTATTPFTNGHLNIFPLPAQPQQFAGGLPAHEGRLLRNIYQQVRDAFGDVMFQLNHPRLTDPLDVDGDNAYFDHLLDGNAYDPKQPLSSENNRSLIDPEHASGTRDIDFDLMEIANGSQYEAYKITRADWFSLLNQGEKIFASANSDTHGASQLVAIPQNYVKMSEEYTEEGFIDALRQGRMIGTTGPLLDVHAMTADGGIVNLGETVGHGKFTLAVKVDAASWVPVEQLTVYLNGRIYHQQAIARGDRVEISVIAETAGHVIVEVTARPSEQYSAVAPGFTPFAFSNPIFIEPGGL